MAFATTALTPTEQAKVPTPGYVPLTFAELELAMSRESGARPRVYGYIEPLEGEPWGQIVTLASQYSVDLYAGRLSFAWLSNTTISDLIGRA